MKENLEGRVEIEGVSSSTMDAFLQYIYTGSCGYLESGDVDSLISLFCLADRYLVDDLRSRCEEAILLGITVENGADIWDLAQLYQLTEMTTALKDLCSR